MNFEKAMLDPSSVFASPDELVKDGSLSREQKIKLLQRWEFDVRELEVAEEENMGGGASLPLDEILKALKLLHADPDPEHSPPTKQGGA